MALPEHNRFIRFTYFVTILLMFGFVGWLIQASLTSDQPYSAAEANTSVKPSQKPLTHKTAYLSNDVIIAGVESRLDLSGNVRSQLDQSWLEFAQRDLISTLAPSEPLKVFAVYHSYNQKQNQISVTLGYPAPKNVSFNNRIHTVTVEPGQYMVLPDKYVLDSWEQASQYNARLKFNGDYEIYLLSPDYQINQLTAFVAIL